MTLGVYGVVGTLDDSHWATLLQQVGDGRSGMSIRSGLTVGAATGTRVVAVASGQCVQAGTYFIATSAGSPYSVSIAANTGANPRYDVICAQVDWFAAQAAYTAAGGASNLASASAAALTAGASLVAVQGSTAVSPSLPKLIQDPSTAGKWQTPLGRVYVRPGVGQIASSDVITLQPGQVEKTTSGTVTLSDGGSSPQTTTVSFPPYFFTSTPRIAYGYDTGASAGTITNVSTVAGSQSATGFQVTINRSTTTSVSIDWVASGV